MPHSRKNEVCQSLEFPLLLNQDRFKTDFLDRICNGAKVADSQIQNPNQGVDQLPFFEISGLCRIPRPSGGLRIPHIGWNSVHFERAHPVLEGIPNNRDFYFAHSFGVENENKGMIFGITQYGGTIAAVIGRDNIIGCQFHPEKSQVNGLKVMENFCRWNGQC